MKSYNLKNKFKKTISMIQDSIKNHVRSPSCGNGKKGTLVNKEYKSITLNYCAKEQRFLNFWKNSFEFLTVHSDSDQMSGDSNFARYLDQCKAVSQYWIQLV